MEHLYNAGLRLGILTRNSTDEYVLSDTATKEQIQVFLDMLTHEITHLRDENNKMGAMLQEIRFWEKEKQNV